MLALGLAGIVGPPVVASAADGAEASARLLLTEVGGGLEPDRGPDCTAEPGGASRGFSGRDAGLCLSVTAVTGARELTLFLATARSFVTDRFDVGIPGAVGGTRERDATRISRAVSFVHLGRFYDIDLTTRESVPAAAAVEWLRSLAEAHVRLADRLDTASGADAPRASVPQPSAAVRPSVTAAPIAAEPTAPTDQSLVALLRVPDGLRPLGEPLAQPHLAGLDAEAEPGSVADVLASGTSSIAQIYESSDGAVVTVSIARYRYATFAAAALGTERRVGAVVSTGATDDGFEVRSVSDRGVATAFRSGRLLYLVAGTASDGRGLRGVSEVVSSATRALYAAAPPGAHSSFLFPSGRRAALESGVLAAAVCGIVLGLRSLVGRRASGVGRLVVGGGRAVDVAPRAARARRTAWLLAVGQVVALVAAVSAAASVRGPLRYLAAIAPFGLAALGGEWTRRSARSTCRGADWSPGLPAGAVGALATGALVLGAYGLVVGARTWLFVPTLRHLAWSQRLGTAPERLSQWLAVGGVCALVAGGVSFRSARRLGRSSGERLRHRDRRSPVLYLRSFRDDTLTIPTTFSVRRPLLEAFSLVGREAFEESLAWQLTAIGPVVAVAEPGSRPGSLGAARDRLGDDAWQAHVAATLAAASVVVLVAGETDGLRWEIDHVIRAGHLARTVVVMPPVPPHEARARWNRTSALAERVGVRLHLTTDPASMLACVVEHDGSVLAFTADRADEAGYRCAIEAATSWIAAHWPVRSASVAFSPGGAS